MSDITLADALKSARHTRMTLGDLITRAESGDNIANGILGHLLSVPLQDLVNQGPPDPFPRGESADVINEYRKKIASHMVDRGVPIERTAAEIVEAIAGNDPQIRVNTKHVFDLMVSEPKQGRGGIVRGFGDLIPGSGNKRSQAYIIRTETAQRFGIEITGEVKARPQVTNNNGKDSPRILL